MENRIRSRYRRGRARWTNSLFRGVRAACSFWHSPATSLVNSRFVVASTRSPTVLDSSDTVEYAVRSLSTTVLSRRFHTNSGMEIDTPEGNVEYLDDDGTDTDVAIVSQIDADAPDISCAGSIHYAEPVVDTNVESNSPSVTTESDQMAQADEEPCPSEPGSTFTGSTFRQNDRYPMYSTDHPEESDDLEEETGEEDNMSQPYNSQDGASTFSCIRSTLADTYLNNGEPRSCAKFKLTYIRDNNGGLDPNSNNGTLYHRTRAQCPCSRECLVRVGIDSDVRFPQRCDMICSKRTLYQVIAKA
jgi:hypothetical protein